MSTLTTVEVAEAAVAVEITGGDTPAVEATLVDAPGVVEVIVPGPQGPQGETGPAGPPGTGSGAMTGVPTFIQATAPTIEQLSDFTKFAWWDTSGGNLTLWIEDGA